jgi:hypothetical protein
MSKNSIRANLTWRTHVWNNCYCERLWSSGRQQDSPKIFLCDMVPIPGNGHDGERVVEMNLSIDRTSFNSSRTAYVNLEQPTSEGIPRIKWTVPARNPILYEKWLLALKRERTIDRENPLSAGLKFTIKWFYADFISYLWVLPYIPFGLSYGSSTQLFFLANQIIRTHFPIRYFVTQDNIDYA